MKIRVSVGLNPIGIIIKIRKNSIIVLKYNCHYCGKDTKDVGFKNLPTGFFHMKCSSCNVTYKLVDYKLAVVNIRVDYKGNRYYYKHFINYNDHMALLKFNSGEHNHISKYFTKICEVDPSKITPDNALKKLPLFLTFS